MVLLKLQKTVHTIHHALFLAGLLVIYLPFADLYLYIYFWKTYTCLLTLTLSTAQQSYSRIITTKF